MTQAIPDSYYTVQADDTLSSIAQQYYGTSSRWQDIYIANSQVIGENPAVLPPGKKLFIPNVMLSLQTCTVTAANGIKIRVAPTTQSTVVTIYPIGTPLNFVEVVNGEFVEGNPRWGHSIQGHYFWMGATDRPNG